MSNADNEKGKRTNNGRNKTGKSRKNQNTRRKGNLLVPGNIESGHHQTSGDERKNIKRVSLTNEKTSRNQALQRDSYQRDKHLDYHPCKILWTILETGKGRTLTNIPEDKKTNDVA